MGMTPEDIQRIMGERNKSSDEKRQEREQEEDQRREAELRQRQQRETLKKIDELSQEEVTSRAEVRFDEDYAWNSMEETMLPIKQKVLRQAAVVASHMRAEEAKRRQAAELAEYEKKLSGMSVEEREAFVNAQQSLAKKQSEELLEREKARLAREQRRIERRLARQKKDPNACDDLNLITSSDDDADNGGKSQRKGKNGRSAAVDELEHNLHERYSVT